MRPAAFRLLSKLSTLAAWMTVAVAALSFQWMIEINKFIPRVGWYSFTVRQASIEFEPQFVSKHEPPLVRVDSAGIVDRSTAARAVLPGLSLVLGQFGVAVPLWAVFLTCIFLSIWTRRAVQRLMAGVCPDCGYALSGLKAAACPECGRALTNINPSSAADTPP
ncbi:MAG: hypothetical protein K2Y21_07345 [Phycisphaerales bacterium]|nr:hypothetical protein [Phycisphaerales bacterium]